MSTGTALLHILKEKGFGEYALECDHEVSDECAAALSEWLCKGALREQVQHWPCVLLQKPRLGLGSHSSKRVSRPALQAAGVQKSPLQASHAEFSGHVSGRMHRISGRQTGVSLLMCFLASCLWPHQYLMRKWYIDYGRALRCQKLARRPAL